MKPVVVFGNGRLASLAHFYLTHDSVRDVAAFTVDRHHRTDDTLFGLPVIPADEVVIQFPPDQFDMFVALGYAQVNKFREAKYLEAKAMGYELISCISSKATVWPGTEVGDNCSSWRTTSSSPSLRSEATSSSGEAASSAPVRDQGPLLRGGACRDLRRGDARAQLLHRRQRHRPRRHHDRA